MAEHPKRITLSRAKGWKMPPNTVKVTRPGKWGNHFIVSPSARPGTRSGALYTNVPTVEDAVECYRLWLFELPGWIDDARHELRGKNLACWCKPGEPCHADVLLEIANAPSVSAGGRDG